MKKNSVVDYAALAAEAEKAVNSVNDPELKRVAFEKILETLLAGGSAQPSSPSSRSFRSRPAPRARRKDQPSERKTKRRAGPKGRVEEMIDEGFFKVPKTIAQVKAELGNHGHHIPLTGLSGPLQALCQDKKLRRQKKEQGKKRVYLYSNW